MKSLNKLRRAGRSPNAPLGRGSLPGSFQPALVPGGQGASQAGRGRKAPPGRRTAPRGAETGWALRRLTRVSSGTHTPRLAPALAGTTPIWPAHQAGVPQLLDRTGLQGAAICDACDGGALASQLRSGLLQHPRPHPSREGRTPEQVSAGPRLTTAQTNRNPFRERHLAGHREDPVGNSAEPSAWRAVVAGLLLDPCQPPLCQALRER